MQKASNRSPWVNRVVLSLILLVALFFGLSWLISRADGPIFVFAGGPLRSGEEVGLSDMDWNSLDALHELEMEIVGSGSSLTLWFSVHNGVPYVACDLDCVGGMLTRWPQQIDLDQRVVVRIDEKRAKGQLVHIPHETTEYTFVRAGRNQKYAGGEGGRAAAETAAHSTVVNVGEVLTGRDQSNEPGDRLYRIDPR
ncbi:MAG: hypothetical protein VX252_11880 [Myxococcota bacterium]|nr:hypothetical protein [Myxococcota bacterium]